MSLDRSKKYQTRDGRPVTIYTFDNPMSLGVQPIVGLVKGKDHTDAWNADGAYFRHGGPPCDTDLVPVPDASTVYAAAAEFTGHVPGYITSTKREALEKHGLRAGPIVEVTLPRDPPKPAATPNLVWHDEGRPVAGVKVLADVETEQTFHYASHTRQGRGFAVRIWDGSRWTTQDRKRTPSSVQQIIHKWAYFNEENAK